MTATHFHLILNHAPAAAIVCGLFLVALSRWKEQFVTASLLLYVAAALTVIPVYLTGDEAEEQNEGGVNHELVEEHAEAAQFALATTLTVGVASVLALIVLAKSDKRKKMFLIVTTVLALWALSTIVRTAYLGGQLRHEEIVHVAE
jgi:asparagine N-glycosylation enzyme membrane subunit Stt3